MAPELPLDQRLDDAGSLVYDTEPLEAPLAIVGSTLVAAWLVAADKPQAMVAGADIQRRGAPDGAATRVSYGILNLAHRESHGDAVAADPGRQRYDVEGRLTEAAHVFARGRRIRIAISSCLLAHMVVPSPEAATLTLWTGESRAILPVLPPDRIRALPDFPPVAKATALARTVHDSGGEKREVHYDAEADKTTVRNTRNDGSARIDDIDTTISYGKVKEFSIARNDPETAESVISTTMHYRRAGWDARLQTRIRMRCTRESTSSSILTSMPSKAANAASAAALSIRSRATIPVRGPEPVSEIRIRDDLAGSLRDPGSRLDPDAGRQAPGGTHPPAALFGRAAGAGGAGIHPLSPARRHHPRRHAAPCLFRRRPWPSPSQWAVRVDLRGAGDSDGLLLDEYLAQEHDDALAVLSTGSRPSPGATARSG